mmetsp:Transcript_21731/g.21435  ORF Transcript_21731/g.21435 Transcript_21731/m.21435 type:complete len:213 (+) Transcript_21731:140-778(+)
MKPSLRSSMKSALSEWQSKGAKSSPENSPNKRKKKLKPMQRPKEKLLLKPRKKKIFLPKSKNDLTKKESKGKNKRRNFKKNGMLLMKKPSFIGLTKTPPKSRAFGSRSKWKTKKTLQLRMMRNPKKKARKTNMKKTQSLKHTWRIFQSLRPRRQMHWQSLKSESDQKKDDGYILTKSFLKKMMKPKILKRKLKAKEHQQRKQNPLLEEPGLI